MCFLKKEFKKLRDRATPSGDLSLPGCHLSVVPGGEKVTVRKLGVWCEITKFMRSPALHVRYHVEFVRTSPEATGFCLDVYRGRGGMRFSTGGTQKTSPPSSEELAMVEKTIRSL